MTIFKRAVIPNITIDQKKDYRKLDDDILRYLNEEAEMLDVVLNGGIGLFDNLDSVGVEFTSSATPDAENTVAHTLGKVPTGYIVYSLDKGAVVYNGTTAWTATNIYLKVNTASVAVKIMVF